MPVEIAVTGQAELAALAVRLKAAPPVLKRELRKELQAAGKPAVDHVRDAIRTIPIRGSGGGGSKARAAFKPRKHPTPGMHGLRETIARATKMQVLFNGDNSKITIRTFTRNLPEGQRKLPRYLDSDKGWRHPVFGRRKDPWVKQTGKPWFYETLKKEAPNVRVHCLAAMRRTAEMVTGR